MDIYIGSLKMPSTLFGKKICTLHTAYYAGESVCTRSLSPSSFLRVSVWKFRVHLLVNKFSRGKRRALRAGRAGGISGKICAPSTVNNAETESEILRSCRLKRLRHASIKLKSAKWVFLQDLHRLNCNGFLFLVSPADIMMWPLLLLLLSLFSFYSTSCFLVVSSAS